MTIVTFGFCCCFGCGSLTFDCRRRRKLENDLKSNKNGDNLGEPIPEQPQRRRQTNLASKKNADYNLLRGICMVSKIICLPMLELARDCGVIHGPILGDELGSEKDGDDDSSSYEMDESMPLPHTSTGLTGVNSESV